MSKTACSNRWLARSVRAACVAWAMAGSFASAAVDAEAREAATASRLVVTDEFTSAEIERLFWECDYIATTFGIGLEEGAYCATISDEVKRRKFDGDFNAMLAWWQLNKAAEHAALAARSRATKAP
jgi:hypothetical protein